MRYRCLVMDHDDTVVQSEQTINYPYFTYILDQFRPGTTITLQEYTDGCYNEGFSEMCRRLYNFTEQELIDEYRGWQGYILDHIPDPYPGIERILHRQKEEGGILCVVSHSCNQNITRDYTRHFGMLPDDIYGWDLPEALRKPSPYPIQDIMKRYGLKPEEILVVDDMKPGYQMASAAGVPIAFAAWSRQDHPTILKEMSSLCDFTFHSPQDLEKFLFE